MWRSARVAIVAIGIMAAAVLTACTAVAPTTASPSATESDLGALGAADCSPPSPSLGLEVQGTGSAGVTAYGLMFGPEPDAMVGDGSSVKMVVRMTGSGDLTVHLIAPDGSEQALDWGPEIHGGSNFHRPGDEWGIGFSPDAPGCWQISLERGGDDRADFWFDVQE